MFQQVFMNISEINEIIESITEGTKSLSKQQMNQMVIVELKNTITKILKFNMGSTAEWR